MAGKQSARRNRDDLRKRIAEAVTAAEFPSVKGWDVLDELSTSTTVDGIEVFDDMIKVEDGRFSGPMNVFVRLTYEGQGRAPFGMSDAFPGSFSGRVTEDGAIVLDEISVDTSSFHA